MVPAVAPGPQRWGQHPDRPPRDPLARPGPQGWSWFPVGPKGDLHTSEKQRPHTVVLGKGLSTLHLEGPLGPVVFMVWLVVIETFLRTYNSGSAEQRVLGGG